MISRYLSLFAVFILFSPVISALTIYETDTFFTEDERVYPTTDLTGKETDIIMVQSCPEEYISASFALKSDTNIQDISIEISDIGLIPKENIDIRVVKCWYQRGDDFNHPAMDIKLYLPELLLHDDELVTTDFVSMSEGTNYIKTTTGNLVEVTTKGEGSKTMDIRDADTLQPFDLATNENKQFWITILIPDIIASTYSGTINIKQNNQVLESLEIQVEVLPFKLPESSVQSSIYYSNYINGRTLGHRSRDATQIRAEYENLKAHGIKYPPIGTWFDFHSFEEHMDIWSDVYGDLDRVYWTTPMIMGERWPTGQVASKLSEMKSYFVDNHGTTEFFYYTEDETDTIPQAQHIAEARSVGVKTYCAQSTSTILTAMNHDPPLLDLATLHGPPIQGLSDMVHSKGKEIGSYSNPQSGEEKPDVYRKNFGLVLWQNDVDVAMNFGYNYGWGFLWNDWDWDDYKQETMAYPTSNGVVDTVQWEGYREGINDVRYVNYLESIADFGARTYLDNLKNEPLTNKDLDEIREEIIEHILRIEQFSVPGFEIIFVLLGIICMIGIKKRGTL